MSDSLDGLFFFELQRRDRKVESLEENNRAGCSSLSHQSQPSQRKRFVTADGGENRLRRSDWIRRGEIWSPSVWLLNYVTSAVCRNKTEDIYRVASESVLMRREEIHPRSCLAAWLQRWANLQCRPLANWSGGEMFFTSWRQRTRVSNRTCSVCPVAR